MTHPVCLLKGSSKSKSNHVNTLWTCLVLRLSVLFLGVSHGRKDVPSASHLTRDTGFSGASWEPLAEEEGTAEASAWADFKHRNMEEIPQNLWSESFKKKHRT